mgnify:CR=1 FL=1
MHSVFNYNTLQAKLDRSTRTIFVELSRSKNDHSINMEMLFELESLFAWLTNKVEIHSVFITSEQTQTNLFSSGYDTTNIKNYSAKQLEKLTEKLQKIVQAMQYLPQTIIVDLKKGAKNIGCELAIGADIRIAHQECQLEFNHNKLGLVPSSSGMSSLSIIVGLTHTKNFLLTGKAIKSPMLLNSGFVFDSYSDFNREDTINDLLGSIHEQAPVQRIQTKLGAFDLERTKYDQSMKVEKQISKASFITEDWKNIKVDLETSKDDNEFMQAKSMSYVTKLTLVKDDNSPDTLN